MKVRFAKPIKVGEKVFEEVDLDLEKLTGKDVMNCVREAEASKGTLVLSYRLDPWFHLQVAAKLTGIPAALLEDAPYSDFSKVMDPIQGFFVNSD